jgi:hypothetical protein
LTTFLSKKTRYEVIHPDTNTPPTGIRANIQKRLNRND